MKCKQRIFKAKKWIRNLDRREPKVLYLDANQVNSAMYHAGIAALDKEIQALFPNGVGVIVNYDRIQMDRFTDFQCIIEDARGGRGWQIKIK